MKTESILAVFILALAIFLGVGMWQFNSRDTEDPVGANTATSQEDEKKGGESTGSDKGDDLPVIDLDPKVRYAHVEKAGEPLWGVRIGNLREGEYNYSFNLDGQVIADPLNPGQGVSPYARYYDFEGLSPKISSFAYPVAGVSPLPGPDRNMVEFVYSGEIERSLIFRADFRGGMWGGDEFQPLNEAARINLEKIHANEDLGCMTGVVRDEAGKPLHGAEVMAVVSSVAPQRRINMRCVKTDREGRYSIDRLDAGQGQIMARATGFQMSMPSQISLLSGPTTTTMDFELSPGAMISGTIRGIDNRPIRGAQILISSQNMYGGSLPLTTMSDSAGNYAITNLGDGMAQMRVVAEGFATASRSVSAIKFDDTTRHEDFILERGVRLRGKVVRDDKARQGVADAWIRVSGSLSNGMDDYTRRVSVRQVAKSDSEGYFTVDGLSPRMQVSFSGQKGVVMISRSELVRMPADGSSPETVELVMAKTGPLRGVVLDAERKPVSGAKVTAAGAWQTGNYRAYVSSYGYGEDVVPETKSDEQGRFELQDLPLDGEIVVQAEAEGFAPGRSEKVRMARKEEAEIILTVGGSLKGKVLIGETDKPVEGMQVWVMEMRDSHNDPDMRAPVKTDASGAFEVAFLPPGKYMVGGEGSILEDGVQKRLFLNEVKQIKIVEGEQVKRTFKAKYCGVIRGRVTIKETGEPVGSVRVYAQNLRRDEMSNNSGMRMLNTQMYSSTSSDNKGEFLLPSVMPGRYTLVASKQGLVADPSSQDKIIEVKEGEEITGIELTISQGGTITGVVLGEDEKPFSGISLMQGGQHGYYGQRQISDEEGRFKFTGINYQNGSVQIISVSGSTGSSLLGKSEEVTLTEEAPSAEVVVRMKEGGSISGTVTDEEGNPIAEVRVTRQRDTRNERMSGSYINYSSGIDGPSETVTDAAGVYAIKGMHAGVFNLTFTKEGHVTQVKQSVRVDEGKPTAGVNIVLKTGAQFRGILNDAEGAGLSGWSVSMGSGGSSSGGGRPGHSTTSANGAFDIKDIEKEKKFTVSFGKNEYRNSNQQYNFQFVSAPVEIGDDVQTFTVDANRTIRGRIVWEGTSEGVGEASIDLGQNHSSSPSIPSDGQCVLKYITIQGMEKSEANGSFEVSGVPAGSLSLSVRGSGVKSKPITIEVLNDLPVTDLGDLEVERGTVVTGRLIDSETNEPYQLDSRYGSPRVRLQSGRNNNSVQLEMEDEGRFEIPSVPDDLLLILFEVQNFLPKEIRDFDLEPGEVTDLGDVVLERGLTLVGSFVDDESGEPYNMTRSYVQAQAEVEGKTSPPSLSVSSEGSNRFRATRVPLNMKSITFITQKHLPTKVEVFPEANEEGEIDLGEVRLKAGITVKGEIVDADDKPISGAIIELSSSGGQPYISRNEKSDSSGKFTLTGLTANVYRITASMLGFVTVEKKDYSLKSDEEPEDLRIILEKARRVECKLTDLNDQSLEGWTVQVRKVGVSAYSSNGQIVTDSEGAFVLDNIGSQDVYLDLRKYGNTPGMNESMAFRSGVFHAPESEDEDLVFVLEMGLGVRGRIVYAGTTDAVGGVSLQISQSRPSNAEETKGTRCLMRSFSKTIQIPENGDGTFEMPSLPLGTFGLSISGKSIVQKSYPSFELKGDEEKDLGDIEVERSHTFIGRFVSKSTGDPIKLSGNNNFYARGRTLSGQYTSMQTAAVGGAGEFKITGVPSDLMQLDLELSGYDTHEIKKIEFDSGEETDLGDVELSAGYSLVMELIDGATGKPYVIERSYGSVSVRVENKSGNSSGTSSAYASNNKGEYTMKQLRYIPAKVTLSPEGLKPVTITDVPDPQEDGRIDLGQITLETGIILEGTVTDSADEPIMGANVTIRKQQSSVSFYRSARTDADGKFSLKGLDTGQYTLSVSKEGYASKVVKDLEYEDGGIPDVITIVLEEGVVLKGVLIDLNAEGLVNWDVSATGGGTNRSSRTKADGSFELKDLAASATYKFSINSYQNIGADRISMSFRTGEMEISPDKPTVIVVPTGVAFKGRVVLAGSSTGVEGAGISVSSSSSGQVEPQGEECMLSHASATLAKGSDAEGRFSIGPLPTGVYSLTFSGKDFVRKSLSKQELTAEGDGDLGDVEVEQSRVLKARLIEKATGEGYMTTPNRISINSKTGAGSLRLSVTKIECDGSIEITGAPQSLSEMTITTPDHVAYVIKDADLLKSGNLGDIVLDRGITLRFKLLDSDTGKTYASGSRSSVQVKTEGVEGKASRSYSATEDGDGYVIKRIAVAIGSLTIEPPDRAPFALESVPKPDREGVIDLGELTLQGGELIEVSLKGPDGEVAKQASVTIRSKSGRSVRGTTNDEGVVVIRGLVAGEKTLTAYANSERGNTWIKEKNKNVWIRNFKFEIPEGEQLAIDLTFPVQ